MHIARCSMRWQGRVYSAASHWGEAVTKWRMRGNIEPHPPQAVPLPLEGEGFFVEQSVLLFTVNWKLTTHSARFARLANLAEFDAFIIAHKCLKCNTKNLICWEKCLLVLDKEKEAVKEKCAEERPEAEAVVKDKLSSKHGKLLDEDVLEASKKAVDKTIEPAEKVNELTDVQEKVVTKSHHH